MNFLRKENFTRNNASQTTGAVPQRTNLFRHNMVTQTRLSRHIATKYQVEYQFVNGNCSNFVKYTFMMGTKVCRNKRQREWLVRK